MRSRRAAATRTTMGTRCRRARGEPFPAKIIGRGSEPEAGPDA
jgi:hypothetical protein